MKTDTKATTITVRKSFSASPERVFDAWISPETAKKFLFATSDGEIIRCEIDARAGGKFVITRRDAQGDTDHVGEYEVVDRPQRLVFTFGVPRYSPEMTRVSIDILPTAQGCDLTLTHEGVLSEWAEKSKEGWTMILDSLEDNLG
jgi:uncharacterized protein YndB with AHSA1/START domain